MNEPLFKAGQLLQTCWRRHHVQDMRRHWRQRPFPRPVARERMAEVQRIR